MPRGRPKKSAETKPAAKPTRGNGNGANLGFEAQLFLAADKLRKNLEPSDYKHVALGLIFLKHISNAFEAKRAALLAEDAKAAEDPDEYRCCSDRISTLLNRVLLPTCATSSSPSSCPANSA